MKVLFISHEATRTGAPIALLREVLFLKSVQDDLECEVLMLNGGDLLDDFKKYVITHKGWLDLTIWVRIFRKIGLKRATKPYLYKCGKHNYDLIYANTVAAFKVAVELKNKYKIPLIGHVHEAENLMSLFEMSKDIFLCFDKLIAVSELTKRNLVELYNVPIERIVLQHPVSIWISEAIENGIDIKKTNKLTDDLIVGVFCNGGWYKSTELIPVAISNYLNHYPDINCKFTIVGNIDEISLFHLKYDLRKAGVLDKVLFQGPVNNPLESIACFDVFLLLSREESFSLVAAESAFVETPVAGFDGVTGAAEWMKNGAGIFVPYLDFDQLSNAIYALHNNTEQRQSIVKEAKRRIMEMYEKEASMPNIISALMKITNKC